VNDRLLPSAYLFITNLPFTHNLTGLNTRCVIASEGFQITDFKKDRAFPGPRAAHQARKAHADLYQVLSSIRQHSEIPVTFDGSPPELAFSDQSSRLMIGNTYLVPDAQGVERPARLMSAVVNEPESSVWGVFALEDGQQIIVKGPLAEDELAAYRRHPETFFGVEQHVGGKLKTTMDAVDFFLDGYAATPRERLLEFMANHTDVTWLATLSRDDLVELYAERCALSLPELAQARPGASEGKAR
jgi:hypothetical protein